MNMTNMVELTNEECKGLGQTCQEHAGSYFPNNSTYDHLYISRRRAIFSLKINEIIELQCRALVPRNRSICIQGFAIRPIFIIRY